MATTLQQPLAIAASDCQQHYKMRIDFLAGQGSEDTEMVDSSCAPPPAPAPVPVAAKDSQMSCYRPERLGTAIVLPSLRLDGLASSYRPSSAPQLPCISSFSSTNSFDSASGENCWAGSNASHPSSTTSSLSSIDTSPAKRHDRLWDIESAASVTCYHSTNSFSGTNSHPADHHNQQPMHAIMMAEPLSRTPRPARISYSEQQRFFITYYRVVKKLSWPEIEDKFATIFNLRTKDGLTSVYYRIRKDWGMEEVFKAGRDGSVGDRGKVQNKAAHFSRDFLTSLGYFD